MLFMTLINSEKRPLSCKVSPKNCNNKQHWNKEIILFWTKHTTVRKTVFKIVHLTQHTPSHTHTHTHKLCPCETFLMRIMKCYKSNNKRDFSLSGTGFLTFWLRTHCQWPSQIQQQFFPHQNKTHKHTYRQIFLFVQPPLPPRSQRYKPELPRTTLRAVCLEMQLIWINTIDSLIQTEKNTV